MISYPDSKNNMQRGRGANAEVMKGEPTQRKAVMVEFSSMERAHEWYGLHKNTGNKRPSPLSKALEGRIEWIIES